MAKKSKLSPEQDGLFRTSINATTKGMVVGEAWHEAEPEPIDNPAHLTSGQIAVKEAVNVPVIPSGDAIGPLMRISERDQRVSSMVYSLDILGRRNSKLGQIYNTEHEKNSFSIFSDEGVKKWKTAAPAIDARITTLKAEADEMAKATRDNFEHGWGLDAYLPNKGDTVAERKGKRMFLFYLGAKDDPEAAILELRSLPMNQRKEALDKIIGDGIDEIEHLMLNEFGRNEYEDDPDPKVADKQYDLDSWYYPNSSFRSQYSTTHSYARQKRRKQLERSLGKDTHIVNYYKSNYRGETVKKPLKKRAAKKT